MRKVTLHDRDGLCVWASVRDDGALLIEGQDLRPTPFGDEYEYFITVAAADVPRVVAALGGAAGADVLGLLTARGEEIVRADERAWLRSLGIEPGFWNRVG